MHSWAFNNLSLKHIFRKEEKAKLEVSFPFGFLIIAEHIVIFTKALTIYHIEFKHSITLLYPPFCHSLNSFNRSHFLKEDFL
jgi:hypothetical protein